MVAPCIRVLIIILLIFMVQGNAAPIPLEGREVSSGLFRPGPQNSSQDSTSFLSHGPKDPSVPQAAVGAVHVLESQPSSESDIFAGQAHPAAHAAPMPLEGREASSGVSRPSPQSSCQDSISFLSHGPKDPSVPEAAVGVVHVPESQPSSESDIFAGQAHPAAHAAPMPLEGGEVSSGLSRPDPQNPCQDSTSFLSHGPKDDSVPEAAVGVVHVPESHEDQPSHEGDIFAGQAPPPTAHSFLSTHLALVITLCTVTPSALCLALYVLIRCCRNRRKASRNDGRSAGGSDRSFDKRPATPPKTAEPFQAHLEYPRMVYVPPTPRDGKQPLFGHYLTPCGQVVGVKDTWTLAPMGRVVNPDGSDGLRIANPPS